MNPEIYTAKAMPTPYPEGGVPTPWKQNARALRESVSDGTFVPIIGSECSTIARESTQSWWDMSEIMSKRRTEVSDGARLYLQSLMTAKHVSKGLARDSDTGEGDDGPAARLQGRLVELAHKANEVFAGRMKLSAINDLTAFCVEVVDADERLVLNERLVKACVAAFELWKSLENNRCDPARAGEIGVCEEIAWLKDTHRCIYERLLDFASKFMGKIPGWEEEPFSVLKESGETERHLHQVREELVTRLDPETRPHQLFLYQLEWLANMVFHSFSLYGHFYPSDDELSFRASLSIPGSDRRSAPANVFEKAGNDLVKDIPRWFTRYKDKTAGRSTQMKAFYDAIARVLEKQTGYMCGKEKRKDEKELVEPIAFCLNLDQELEKALQDLQVKSYHVALPVRATVSRETGDRFEQRWLLGTFSSEPHTYEKPEWTWLKKWFGQDQRINMPLVVKLHGSPLHEIPKDPEEVQALGDTSVTGVDHLITLSESAYLQNIVVVRSIPPIFDDVFRRSRSFYFIGLSASEWNMHLQISDFVFPGPVPRQPMTMPQGKDRDNGKRIRSIVAISEEFDDYRSCVLRYLGVRRWKGPLDDLANEIRNAV